MHNSYNYKNFIKLWFGSNRVDAKEVASREEVWWAKTARTQNIDGRANAVCCHFVWVQAHSTCKSGESCISFKEINFLHSWGKKGAVIYLDFINCVNRFDNAHTLVTSKYSLQELLEHCICLCLWIHTSSKGSLFL